MRYENIREKAISVAAVIAAVGLVANALVGCSTSRSRSRSSDEAIGSVLGGSVGARKDKAGSGVIGRYVAEQVEAMSALDDVRVEQIGNEIKLTWSSADLFDFDSAMLKQVSLPTVAKMAEIFVKYPDTYIVVTGHTDTEGEEDYNQKLSERRAISVRNYLEEKGVESMRLETIGYGELRPIASNSTDEGRRKNQRVEITVRPNEELRRRDREAGKQ